MKDAAYYQAYRHARKALGRACPRGSGRALSFVAWDGEGETIEPAGGLPSGSIWNDAVRMRAGSILADRTAAEGPLWAALDQQGGRIVPGAYNGRERGEYADIPKHLKRKAHGDGNADKIAQLAGVSVDELLSFFSGTHRRPSWNAALAQARVELQRDRPRAGVHNYTLLANSRDGVVARGESLTSTTIFDALVAGRDRYPDAIHVIFGGSYDMTMALRDLPRHEVERVWSAAQYPARVADTYGVLYRPRRSLFVARFGRPAWVDRKPNYVGKAMLWDVWGFFQSSFVTALGKYGFDPAIVSEIARMKALRPTFSARDRAEVEAYCVMECELLEQLMGKLSESLLGAGLRPRAWNGAGAVAAALLSREGVKDHISAPPAALDGPITRAYFGGRVELCQLGWVQGRVDGADVASAYPWGMQELPALHGQWNRSSYRGRCSRESGGGFGVYRVRFRFTGALPWYPLPYRTDRGTILFPAVGEGWYWEPEVAQAIAFAQRWGGEVNVVDGWAIDDDGTRPFSFVPALFAKRKEWQRAGNGAEKAAKLGLNSLYGKMAQQLGGTKEKPPPFFSLAWAGYVTSCTRARLVEAAMNDPHSVIAFSTDGIASTRPLDLPDYGTGLGSWESTFAHDGVFAQAGVYWLRNDAGAWEAKYRGFDQEMLQTPDNVLDAWCAGIGQLQLQCTRFVALGSALCSEECWEARGTWRTIPRTLDLSGGSAKRVGNRMRDARLTPLAVQWNVDYDVTGSLSAPYKVAWEVPIVDGAPEETIEEEAADSMT